MIFPRAAKCTYEAYGPSGSNQKFDALCLLPLNVFNQKIFVLVWIWFLFVCIISILNLWYWFLVSCNACIRIYILRQKSLQSVSLEVIIEASRKAQLGHFFVLNQIAKNTNPETFIGLLTDLAINITNSEDDRF